MTRACLVLIAVTLALLAAGMIDAAGRVSGANNSPEEMKSYVETIPGANVKFEMVPIPGGTFTMGSPATEAGRGNDEGPQCQVTIRPFWMETMEVTWDEYDLFAFSQDLKKDRQMKLPEDKT